MKKLLPFAAILACACAGSGAQLEKQKAEIDELQGEVISLRQALNERGEAGAAALAAAKTELEARSAELAAAEAGRASLERSNRELSVSLKSKQGELGGKLSAALAEKDELSRRLAEAGKERASGERQRAALKAAREKAAAELAKAQEEARALGQRLTAADEAAAKAEAERAAARLRARERMGEAADALLSEIQAGTARVEQRGESFAAELSEPLLFKEHTAELTEPGAALLARLAASLKAMPLASVRVEGHTDDAPVKKGLLGGFSGRWELSAARAAAAARGLQEAGGLPGGVLEAAGLAEFRPAKPNDGPAGRAANRRVTIVAVLR